MSGTAHWLRSRGGEFRRARGLPFTDRGFRYGMAVFETIAVRRGKLLFLEEHLRSGLEACRVSGFAVEEGWFDDAGRFLRENLAGEESGVARIHITAGDGAPVAPANHCRMLLSFEPREPIATAVYERGYLLGICPSGFQPTLDGRKTHNYWQNIIGLQAAQAAGADESLVFNKTAVLASACMANVFLVLKDGEIVTPSLTTGARNGIVRQWVLKHGNVREGTIKRSDVRQTRELFLTSSWLGIMPASKLEAYVLPENTVSNELLGKYHCQFIVGTSQNG